MIRKDPYWNISKLRGRLIILAARYLQYELGKGHVYSSPSGDTSPITAYFLTENQFQAMRLRCQVEAEQ